RETWKTILQIVISILTAALTALGTTSCMQWLYPPSGSPEGESWGLEVIGNRYDYP
ncbi:MAG: smalltalk protein, partial [Prevotella sp.]|nr:smalltalk protein [Prevotella sp.]